MGEKVEDSNGDESLLDLTESSSGELKLKNRADGVNPDNQVASEKLNGTSLIGFPHDGSDNTSLIDSATYGNVGEKGEPYSRTAARG
jgi:hypothetical protein